MAAVMRRLLVLALVLVSSTVSGMPRAEAVDGARSIQEMRAIIVRFGELSACFDHGLPIEDFTYLQGRVTVDADRNEIATDTRDLLWGEGRQEFDGIRDRTQGCLALRGTLMAFYPR